MTAERSKTWQPVSVYRCSNGRTLVLSKTVYVAIGQAMWCEDSAFCVERSDGRVERIPGRWYGQTRDHGLTPSISPTSY